ncbi:CDP-glycerol glycerophosphotransferase family protein [Yunchengibacter salinarum]|uniref:CDP-glycerol glycerophosphotransferase family protein n=1 Tax=Yunchengibacter salinarum TaxID=3133399 RepID=UPI0035B678EC
MRLTDLAHRRVYVAPANPAGRDLARRLGHAGAEVLGLMDNFKRGVGIINGAAEAESFDYAVVAPGEAQAVICEGLMGRGFPARTLLTAMTDDTFRPYRRRWSVRLGRLRGRLRSGLFRLARRMVSQKGTVYYAEGFFDSNVLLAYRHHRAVHGKEARLVGFDAPPPPGCVADQPGVWLNRPMTGWWPLVRAARLVVDHEATSDRFACLRAAVPVVQLWHGLPYKALAGNGHYEHVRDAAFLSSSAWFNRHVFPGMFRAARYEALGYPRCDALIQPRIDRPWEVSVSRERLEAVLADTGPLWVYMPTFRDADPTRAGLDLDWAEGLAARHGRSLVLKYHPFVARAVQDALDLPLTDDLLPLPGYPHLYLFPGGRDPYPWLAEAECLITDYSSVAFDFLVCDRPIVYYQFDRDAYQAVRGAAAVPDSLFIAGPVARDRADLAAALADVAAGQDGYARTRRDLRRRLELVDRPATPAIVDFIREIA